MPFDKVLDSFFDENTPESTWTTFFKLLQCWTVKDCKLKYDISDEEIALFFDQLIDLVAAAYIIHQANRVSANATKGNEP